MTYQIGTFFVNKISDDSYQVAYMIAWSSNPEKPGQPSALVESSSIKYLRMSRMEYRAIMISFGAEYKVLFKAQDRDGKKNYHQYERGEMFFKDKDKAEDAADWANARLAELKFTGREYIRGEELKFIPVMPTLIPKSQITPMFPTPPKGNIP